MSVFALKSLLAPSLYTSHDGETHTARIAQYYQALKDGQMPPRFASTLYNGLGSPIFVYIYPAPYIFGSALHVLGFTYADALKLLMSAGFVLSGLFSLLWLKEVFKSEKAAFLGALFYIMVPYRFQLIYVRGSISELLAYTFLPLALYSLTKLAGDRSVKWMAATALSLSLVFLSQNLVALMTFPIVLAYIAIVSLNTKSFPYLIKSALCIAWAFLISAVTYVPSLFERDYIRLDETIQTAYANHFVSIKQLIRSPWGYGFDLPGTLADEMSFQLGLGQILVVILTLALVVYLLAKRAKMPQFKLTLFFVFVFFASAFLTLNIRPNTYLWEHIKEFHSIDLPWRFLGISAVASSFLAAFVAKAAKPGAVFLFLVLFVVVANRNHIRINEPFPKDDVFFDKYTDTTTQYSEFTPKTRQMTSPREVKVYDSKVHVLEGDVSISSVNYNSKEVSFTADVKSQDSLIRIDRFYFPNVSSNVGSVYSSGPSTPKLPNEKDGSGMMLINLTGGTHDVHITYSPTPIRQIAWYTTLVSFSLAIVLLIRNVKKA